MNWGQPCQPCLVVAGITTVESSKSALQEGAQIPIRQGSGGLRQNVIAVVMLMAEVCLPSKQALDRWQYVMLNLPAISGRQHTISIKLTAAARACQRDKHTPTSDTILKHPA